MGGERFHVPVMVDEVIRFLEMGPGEGEILDGTVGGGGHSRAILERIPGSRVLAVDRDPEALDEARRVLSPWRDRVRFLRARFEEAARGAGLLGPSLGGVLLDLGVSSHQIDEEARGFTYRTGSAPLDMRMDAHRGSGPTAAELLNDLDRDELSRLLREYGEEPRARRIAAEIVRRRRKAPMVSAGDLMQALESAYGRPVAPGEASKIFQALRIAVNRELDALDEALPLLREALLPGAVMVVISYHSLEDRRVKNAFREWSRECVCPPGIPVCRCRGRALGELLTRRVVRPDPQEVEANPRSRSARLRAWRKAA